MKSRQGELFTTSRNYKGEIIYSFHGTPYEFKQIVKIIIDGGTMKDYQNIFPQFSDVKQEEFLEYSRRKSKSFYDQCFWTTKNRLAIGHLYEVLNSKGYISETDKETFIKILTYPMNQITKKINWIGTMTECIKFCYALRDIHSQGVNAMLFNNDTHYCKPKVICKIFKFHDRIPTPKKIGDLASAIRKIPNNFQNSEMINLLQ